MNPRVRAVQERRRSGAAGPHTTSRPRSAEVREAVEQPWTCPCGHELDRHGRCIVWDTRGVEHTVPRDSNRCTCHGTGMEQLEGKR